MRNSSVLIAPLPVPLPARPSQGEGEQPCNGGSAKKFSVFESEFS